MTASTPFEKTFDYNGDPRRELKSLRYLSLRYLLMVFASFDILHSD